MGRSANVVRCTLSVLLASLWLTSSLPCASVCAAVASLRTGAVEVAAGPSHCARAATNAGAEWRAEKRAEPSADRPDAPAPCHDDCPGCDVSRLTVPAEVGAGPGTLAHAPLAMPAARRAFDPRRLHPRVLRVRHVADPPPRRVLTLTTILLV